MISVMKVVCVTLLFLALTGVAMSESMPYDNEGVASHSPRLMQLIRAVSTAAAEVEAADAAAPADTSASKQIAAAAAKMAKKDLRSEKRVHRGKMLVDEKELARLRKKAAKKAKKVEKRIQNRIKTIRALKHFPIHAKMPPMSDSELGVTDKEIDRIALRIVGDLLKADAAAKAKNAKKLAKKKSVKKSAAKKKAGKKTVAKKSSIKKKSLNKLSKKTRKLAKKALKKLEAGVGLSAKEHRALEKFMAQTEALLKEVHPLVNAKKAAKGAKKAAKNAAKAVKKAKKVAKKKF